MISAEVLHRPQLRMGGSAVDQVVRKLHAFFDVGRLASDDESCRSIQHGQIATRSLDASCEDAFQDGRIVDGVAPDEFLKRGTRVPLLEAQVRQKAILHSDDFIVAQRAQFIHAAPVISTAVDDPGGFAS